MRLRLLLSVAGLFLISGVVLAPVQARLALRFPYQGVLVRLRLAGLECATAQLARGAQELHIRVLRPALPAVADQLQIEISPADSRTQGCIRREFSALLALPHDPSVEPALNALQRGLHFERGQPEPAALKRLPKPAREQWRRVAPVICRSSTQCKAACDAKLAAACWVLGNWYREGKHVTPDETLAASHLERACELGEARACDPYQPGHDLSAAQITHVIQQLQPKLPRCWQGVYRPAIDPPTAQVTVEVQPSGVAHLLEVSGQPDARVRKCLQRIVAQLRFPESSRALPFTWPVKL